MDCKSTYTPSHVFPVSSKRTFDVRRDRWRFEAKPFACHYEISHGFIVDRMKLFQSKVIRKFLETIGLVTMGWTY